MIKELPKVMTLTQKAADRVHTIIEASQTPIAGLKIGVKNGGCAGMEYTLDYANSIEPGVDVVEDKGVKVVIDPKAILFLLGTEMDYEVSKLSSGFVFNNPNQTSACGCGESVEITPLTSEQAAQFSSITK